MKLQLPLPPSVNHLYGHTRTGIIYKTKEAKEWIQECLWIIKSHHGASYKPTDRILVSIQLFYKDKRKHDIDNILKATFDILSKESGIIPDDNQIEHLILTKTTKTNISEMIIQIEKLV